MELPILCIEYYFQNISKGICKQTQKTEKEREYHCPLIHTFVFNYAIYIQLILFLSHFQTEITYSLLRFIRLILCAGFICQYKIENMWPIITGESPSMGAKHVDTALHH